MWQDTRSQELEWIDLGPDSYTKEEYEHCLTLLDRINRSLGGYRATKKAFQSLSSVPQSILEVGCGGGFLCRRLTKWFPNADIVGIDLSESAIAFSKQRIPSHLQQKVSYEVQQSKSLDSIPGSFDILTTMLVTHHMTDEELITFLQQSYRKCNQAVIINDLHRHLLAYLSYSLITPIAFPNRLIWHDGRLSVRRSFRKKDWQQLLTKAGFQKDQYRLKWHPAFRWTLTLLKR